MCNDKTEFRVELVPRRPLNYITVFADNHLEAKEIVRKLIKTGQIMNLVEGLHKNESYIVGEVED
ncbi:MAG: hypothetical protein E3J83_04320 [Candidatus Atribacteria bacterium]|nr:MAG: hypothetical protein E3J83_04320 [Candidatus Atribacteria bacterium]